MQVRLNAINFNRLIGYCKESNFITCSERTDTKLDHSAIVQDLCRWIGMANVVLGFGHQHQVSCLVPLVVESRVIYAHQDGSKTRSVRIVVIIDIRTQPI